MRKKLFLFTIILFILFFLKTNIYYTLRSYIVMYPYSYYNKLNSIPYKRNIRFYIPGGTITKEKDWYPFVLTFNDNEGFSRYAGRKLSLTIFYNFGHFRNGFSSYYDQNSRYYSSFYGGYVIYNSKDADDPYGFDIDGKIRIKELESIPRYDQTRLVLPSLGCPEHKIYFKSKIDKIEYNIEYLGINDWVKIDSTVVTNGPNHKYRKKHLGYIQYGKPPDNYSGDDFPLVILKGRIYAKYFDDYKMTIILYIVAPNIDTIENCDRNILSKCKINYYSNANEKT
ncbi:hypothetical protein SAMN02745135_00208 [Caloranaerobacter azorensis DSM 13643]|uniref:Uncharacterized protein n=2 Tax=Caloranaerobacter azorensis TaxID=116090 RepID=A0A1M5RGL3_9FIRM|nr:hypothetical protein SAMN02745135_00208 [Caloranaerobacter azorensis DSM 13643]